MGSYKTLTVGDYVKISRGHEGFWLKVKSIMGNEIEAVVDNYLLNTDEHGFDYGDLIKIRIDEIIMAMSGKEASDGR